MLATWGPGRHSWRWGNGRLQRALVLPFGPAQALLGASNMLDGVSGKGGITPHHRPAAVRAG